MESVFIAWHIHEFDDGNEDLKIIGVYVTAAEAQRAIDRVKDKPGFVDRPSGFQVDEYTLGRDNWTEGYISVAEAMNPSTSEE